MSKITIRKGVESDLQQVLNLIVELAIFEREPNAVTNTLERMKQDGFGSNPIFEFYVAEQGNLIVGASLFYYRYSTWKGRCLYLEDLIVTESARGKGIGSLLFERTVQHAKDNHCINMNWQVLDWNQPAIDFYAKYKANMDPEWLNGTLKIQ